jgi:hypothetical protein
MKYPGRSQYQYAKSPYRIRVDCQVVDRVHSQLRDVRDLQLLRGD